MAPRKTCCADEWWRCAALAPSPINLLCLGRCSPTPCPLLARDSYSRCHVGFFSADRPIREVVVAVYELPPPISSSRPPVTPARRRLARYRRFFQTSKPRTQNDRCGSYVSPKASSFSCRSSCGVKIRRSTMRPHPLQRSRWKLNSTNLFFYITDNYS